MPPAERAEFTTNGKRPVVCQRCHESFEEGTNLFYMEDRNRDNPGKHVCKGCRQYYLRKTEAIQRSTTRSSSNLSSFPSVELTDSWI